MVRTEVQTNTHVYYRVAMELKVKTLRYFNELEAENIKGL